MQLKSEVHWIQHPDGYWILRNPEYPTFIQVDNLDKNIICLLGKRPILTIANKNVIHDTRNRYLKIEKFEAQDLWKNVRA